MEIFNCRECFSASGLIPDMLFKIIITDPSINIRINKFLCPLTNKNGFTVCDIIRYWIEYINVYHLIENNSFSEADLVEMRKCDTSLDITKVMNHTICEIRYDTENKLVEVIYI